MKILRNLLIIVLSAIIGIVGLVTLPWVILAAGLYMLPAPPQPEIKYGEFPFRIEYVIDGEPNVINDTLICEYDGIGMDEGNGKYRKWKAHLASGHKRVTLLKINNTQEIYYSVGGGYYYMGDSKYGHKFSFPNADFKDTSENAGFYESNITAEDLLKKYNIKIISWDYTQPIVNKFG